MLCPICGSSGLLRDYANPRAYGFLFFGAFMMLMATLLLPLLEPLYVLPLYAAAKASKSAFEVNLEMLDPLTRAIRHTFGLGLVCLFFGFFDLRRDGGRFCAICGFRGRFLKRKFDEKTGEALSRLQGRMHRDDEADDAGALAPGQPVKPLLKMLRFKNDGMRLQAVTTLTRLTGENFGDDADAWDAWYAEHGESFERKG